VWLVSGPEHGAVSKRAWTRAEKRNCIDAWLKIHTDRTSSNSLTRLQAIADDLRVSQNTVADRRESLETVLQFEDLFRGPPREYNGNGI